MQNDSGTEQQQMLKEVLDGLTQPQKVLPSKYFYDQRGSELFEQITHLDEYYPTRTEKKILEANIDEIADRIGNKSVIIELGSGSSQKTRLLLDHLPHLSAYVPVDISEKYLQKVADDLREEYPNLPIVPVCADYTKPFNIPQIDRPFEYYVVFYPGSTIGNFHPHQAQNFLQSIARFLIPGGGMLIGVDLKKDIEVLERAYNDEEGVTADFNRNMLVRLNRELGADFEVENFSHKALYDREQGRIEMHLVSEVKQQAHLNGTTIDLQKGESIHTENSYKYSLQEFRELVSDWFEVEKVWMDEDEFFSIQYLVKK